MARNRVLYVLAVIGCVIFSMAYTSKISAVLLFVVLLYPVIAVIFVAVLMFGVKAEFTTNRIVTDKNEPFDVSMILKNRSLLPGVPVEIYCHIPDREVGLFADKRVFASISPLGTARLSIGCVHKYRGSYTCIIHSLSVVDPLRIIRLTKKQKKTMAMVFLPRKLKLADILSTSAGEQSFSPKKPISSEREDFSHVRGYREGDIMQLVHWKLTAKQDELMIKQYDSTNDLRAVVLCDYDQKNDTAGMQRADMMIETAIAFVNTALDRGIHSTVDIGDLGAKPPFVSDRGAFERFFDTMSVIPSDLETEDIISMMDRLDKSSAAILIIITDKLTEELIERAKNAAQQVTVFYVYLNLTEQSLDVDLSDERFLFLNVAGTGEDALKTALERTATGAG